MLTWTRLTNTLNDRWWPRSHPPSQLLHQPAAVVTPTCVGTYPRWALRHNNDDAKMHGSYPQKASKVQCIQEKGLSCVPWHLLHLRPCPQCTAWEFWLTEKGCRREVLLPLSSYCIQGTLHTIFPLHLWVGIVRNR